MLTKDDLIEAAQAAEPTLMSDEAEAIVDAVLRTIIDKADGVRVRDDCRALLGGTE